MRRVMPVEKISEKNFAKSLVVILVSRTFALANRIKGVSY